MGSSFVETLPEIEAGQDIEIASSSKVEVCQESAVRSYSMIYILEADM